MMYEIDAAIRALIEELSRAQAHALLAHRRLVAGDEAEALALLNRARRDIRIAAAGDIGAPFRVVTDSGELPFAYPTIENAWAAATSWAADHPGRPCYVATADGRPVGRPEGAR
jgi:hypothetical protein